MSYNSKNNYYSLKSEPKLTFPNILEKSSIKTRGNNILEIKNAKEFYKELNEKLKIHQKEIENRNETITELQNNFEELKINYLKEKNDNLERLKIINTTQKKLNEAQIEIMNFKKMNNIIQNKKDNDNKLLEKIKLLSEENLKINNEKNELLIEINKLKNENKSIICNKDEESLKSKNQIEILKNEIEEKSKIIQDLSKRNKEIELNLDNENKENDEENNIKETIENLQIELNEIHSIKNKIHLQNKDLSYELRKKEIEILDLNNEINLLKRNLASKTSEIINKQEENNHLNQEIQLLESAKLKLEKSLNEMKESSSKSELNLNQMRLVDEIKMLKKSIDTKIVQKSTKDETFQQTLQDLKKKNILMTSEIKDLTSKLHLYTDDITKKSKNSLLLQMSCCNCGKLVTKSVTCIPCGHSYCQCCISGYDKNCRKCGIQNGKVEAIYRNILMDDLISMLLNRT